MKALEKLTFDWKVKEKPEDFIVQEVAEHQFDERGQHYLYLLEKENLTTQELAEKFGFSYAGLKDKVGRTSQYVSFDKHIGDVIEEYTDNTFYRLRFLGRIRKKVKLGRLIGNQFKIKVKDIVIEPQNWFINYYDTQRLRNNFHRGKQVIEKIKNKQKTRKQLSWLENFLIDSYLSYLWNKSLEEYLKEHFDGYYVQEADISFFIPKTSLKELEEKVPKYWAILGYKVDFNQEKEYYKKVLKKEGFLIRDFIEILKNLRIKGDYRKSYIEVSNLKLENGYINFFLPKGSYATMYLKHIYRRKR